MSACPACGAENWRSVQEVYETEVRLPEPDLERLARLAPPTSRASIHGFILAVLVWILLLIPFFASDRGRLRDTAAVAAAVALWIWLYRRARRQDRALREAYAGRKCCAQCGAEAVTPAAG